MRVVAVEVFVHTEKDVIVNAYDNLVRIYVRVICLCIILISQSPLICMNR